VCTARDVTVERKLQAELTQAQRLESIGRLAGGVAHDFNNILTVILGTVGFLEEDVSLGDEARADVLEIKRAGGRASELTNQLLAFARRRVVRPETFSLVESMRAQDRFLRRVIGEHIDLKTDLPADLWSIFADPAQVEQVVVNLAVNARDAMPDGGKLVIEAANVTLDASFAKEHSEIEPGRYVRVVVSDSGEGIKADVLPHIFEPFYTTKVAGAGTGLGLATVYGIVRQCAGHIWVYSEPGVGTTFKLYFPRAPDAEAGAAPEPMAAPRPGSERVLVVEDEDAVRNMMVRVLEGAGYLVHAAPGPDVALAWATSVEGRFDLLLTDVVMPGMSGRQLATLLVERYPSLQVMYVSGYTENTIVHRGVLEQGVAFLAKPFSPDELRRTVRQLLDRG
jgi:two-component system, cell cycle sensor histidine kinase and response regulator CckA